MKVYQRFGGPTAFFFRVKGMDFEQRRVYIGLVDVLSFRRSTTPNKVCNKLLHLNMSSQTFAILHSSLTLNTK